MRVSGIIKGYYSLTALQQNCVNRLIRDMFNLNAQLAEIQPGECPKCGCADGFTKAGFEKLENPLVKRIGNPYARKQIYRCKVCGKSFVYDSGTTTHNLKITQEEFAEICRDTIRTLLSGKRHRI